jgi:hypothetical protein
MLETQATIVVADTSGSMREHGKAMLVRNLLAHIRQSSLASMKPNSLPAPIVVHWNREATVMTVQEEGDLLPLVITGRAAIQPLLGLLDKLTIDTGRIQLLFISDGHLSIADVNTFHSWLHNRPNIAVRAIAVGPDASTATLARLTGFTKTVDRQGLDGASMGSKGWYMPEDLCTALESWQTTTPTAEPGSIAEILDNAAGDDR